MLTVYGFREKKENCLQTDMYISKREARAEALKRGFRSKFELTFATMIEELKLKVEYESKKISYTKPAKKHSYTPDWTIGWNKYIETKGIFSASDRQKTLLVRKQNPEITVYMLFQNSRVTLSKKSKTTYGMWCDDNEIPWADIRDVDKWKGWFN